MAYDYPENICHATNYIFLYRKDLCPLYSSLHFTMLKMVKLDSQQPSSPCIEKPVYLARRGDLFLYQTTDIIGDVGIATEKCTTNQGFQSFIPNDNYSSEFLYYWIIQNKKEFIKKSLGATFIEISKREIQKIEILFPKKVEQSKIADFLSSMDKKIEKLGIQIDDSMVFKKGLLQKMFV